MPRAIPKLCPLLKHGIYEGQRCPKCAAESRARADQHRPSAAARGYDGAWRRVRKDFLAAHPACCAAGCSQPATEVDHVQSIADRPELRLSWSNLRGFCKPHHSQRTGRDQGAFARPATKRQDVADRG
ncbi:HNH endonuclease signature motif containing protein [Azospirillum agricola]|uniref:HNH endonuclease signature motif containing protein n=1 Tax=Azospirillum agricola TaxID=1720247 RepID=UPI000A0EFEF6|nr:HNH endonuclease signature motif containing protein [Azospirillum agricola]SMH60489.1 hypothetical protein SAMN02982994_5525 [Azospirillum lipoferum]